MSHPAIIVRHPHGGVKEQTSGLYTCEIAERTSFITLAFDAAYQGESRGLSHCLKNPYQQADDAHNAVTYLSILEYMNASHIGALGVCASGGYVKWENAIFLAIDIVKYNYAITFAFPNVGTSAKCDFCPGNIDFNCHVLHRKGQMPIKNIGLNYYIVIQWPNC